MALKARTWQGNSPCGANGRTGGGQPAENPAPGTEPRRGRKLRQTRGYHALHQKEGHAWLVSDRNRTATVMKSLIHSRKSGFRIALAGAVACAALLTATRAETDILNELRERQSMVQNVAREALPAVVALTAPRSAGAGSGVIVSADGLILTAGHVLDALPDPFTVTLADGSEVSAKKLGAHRTFDAAMAQITEQGTYPFVPVARSVDVGDWCIAMGHPGGPEADRTPPVRLGKVWKKGRRSGFLTSDCVVSGGDSGGPLFNLSGEVIGIHSSISTTAHHNRHVPITAFHAEWERIKGGESWGRLGTAAILEDDLPWAMRGNGAMLGVQLDGNSPVVVSVLPGSAAEKADIRPQDVIVEFENTAVATTLDLQRMVAEKNPGDEVVVNISRGGKPLSLTVTLGGQS